MKPYKYLAIIFGICTCLMAGACSKEENLGGDGPENPENPENPTDEIVSDKDLQVKVVKASAKQGADILDEAAVKKSFDGDKTTFFQANKVSENPLELVYTLSGTEPVDYCVYSPSSNSRAGSWNEVEVFIKLDGSEEFESVAARRLEFPEWPVVISFGKSVKAREVKFIVKSGNGDNARCAEMEFFRSVKRKFDPLTLFKDATCSELKDGITEADINACEDLFFKAIASKMLEGEYQKNFRINEFKCCPQPSLQASENKTGPFSLYENVTGIYVKRNEKFVVLVGDIPQNESVGLKIIDFTQVKGYEEGMSVALRPGYNEITTANKGLVYIAYHSKDYANLPPVKIHFASGEVNGYFDTSKHTLEEWPDIVNNTKCDFLDVVGSRIHVTYYNKDFQQYCTDPFKLMEVYDSFINHAEEFMGMNKYDRKLVNKVFFHYGSGAYGALLSATNHLIWNNEKSLSIPAAVNPDKLRTTECWGPAHELGHALQIRPGKQLYSGMTEVTNNLLSIYVQLQFGNESRLFNQIQNAQGESYQSDFERAMTYYQSTNSKPHNFGQGDVRNGLTKLIPLWQLYLYFHEVLGKDWFKDYYEELRKSPVESANGDAQMELIRIFCKISNLNLIEFFEHSGFLTPCDLIPEEGAKKFTVTKAMIDDLKTEINSKYVNKPDVQFWRLTDQADNITCFKNKTSVCDGKYTRNNKKFTITGCTGAVAYEVIDDGRVVFVSPHKEFNVNSTISGNVVIKAYGAKGDSKVLKEH